jgi:tRNA A37 threonylcarbamoyladenosine synthetase subunit TsaC/SUA5/YrdC
MARILQPTKESMDEAAELVRNGGLVAFPTETGMN